MLTKFIIRTCVFCIIFITSILLCWKVITFNRRELCKTNKEILLLGNSRIQYGINDDSLHNVLNLGLNADNYFFSYLKLKLMKKYNSQINTVYLGYDKTSIFHYFKSSEDKFHPFYWDLLDMEDIKFIFNEDRACLSSPLHWLKILYPLLSFTEKIDIKELGIGGYTYLKRDKLQQAIQNFKQLEEDTEIEQKQILYLDKIIHFCQENNMQLYFLNMPSYPISYNKRNDEKLDSIAITQYPQIKYYDYEFIYLPDSCYGDIYHINYKGANAFTSLFKKTILKQ